MQLVGDFGDRLFWSQDRSLRLRLGSSAFLVPCWSSRKLPRRRRFAWCTFATTFPLSYKVETVAEYSCFQELAHLSSSIPDCRHARFDEENFDFVTRSTSRVLKRGRFS